MLLKCLFNNKLLFLAFFFVIEWSFGQHKKLQILKPTEIGISYNYGNEKNFLFDDVDYFYTTNTFKIDFSYKIGSKKKMSFDFIIKPQIQVIKHQLLNLWFVTPDIVDYEEKRTRFTQLKTMYLYGFQLGIKFKRQLTKSLSYVVSIDVGLAIIDTETERLAKGFTFIENGVLGFSYQLTNTSSLLFGGNFGHVSNLNFQNPNSGYNQFGFEIGYMHLLN